MTVVQTVTWNTNKYGAKMFNILRQFTIIVDMNETKVESQDSVLTDERSVDEHHPKASGISAIDKGSVHKICSGQVVLTLATAVKELVENSVDAGATIVEIKLREHGSESIEVSDNGIGVQEENFQGLTLKHHTSKLQDFADLINVETFGFRGEALSSLCALGDMCITTRHKSSSVGTRLEFNHHGHISSRTPQARQIGTTVVIQNLFSTLPVRHKEFQRNIKKEFAKMVQVLNSYCLISTGVRITCTNMTGKGNRSTVISTKGNPSLRENIANIFGPKQLQSLLEFQQKTPGEEVCTEFGVKNQEQCFFRLEGYVSKCDHGSGRSSTDRQFFFINGRPFDSTKLTKVLNEVYHQYNRHQYPFVALIINMEKESVDVNVTPDKRQVFLEGEKMILAAVKASLVAMFELTTSVLQLQMPACFQKSGTCCLASEKPSPRKAQSLSSIKESGISSLLKLKRTFSSAFAKESNTDTVSDKKTELLSKQRKLDSFVLHNKSDMEEPECDLLDNNSSSHKEELENNRIDNSIDMVYNNDVFCGSDSGLSVGNSSENDKNSDSHCENDNSSYSQSSQETVTSLDSFSLDKNLSLTFHCQSHDSGSNRGSGSETSKMESIHATHLKSEKYNKDTNVCNNSEAKSFSDKEGCHAETVVTNYSSFVNSNREPMDRKNETSNVQNSVPILNDESSSDFRNCEIPACDSVSGLQKEDSGYKTAEETADPGDCAIILHELDEKHDVDRKEQKAMFSIKQLREHIAMKQGKKPSSEERFSRSFRATISPADNQAAEQELQKEIKKEMFQEMEILGQFNLGFIITKLGEDLFIVDQHATDEKFNFETLQRDTVIQSQKLICPLNLELTASNETILMDNLEIFKKNGFDFVIDEEGPPTQRVKLISTPVSKNWNFGKDDIEEMIFMLTDSPGVTCRPTRVRQMFASRACRKSIMIGTALNKSEMKKLVCHMGEIEQPWNCPHGRPTMRHLINLNMLPR